MISGSRLVKQAAQRGTNLREVTLCFVQLTFKYLQQWRFHSLSGQSISKFDYSEYRFFSPYIQSEYPFLKIFVYFSIMDHCRCRNTGNLSFLNSYTEEHSLILENMSSGRIKFWKYYCFISWIDHVRALSSLLLCLDVVPIYAVWRSVTLFQKNWKTNQCQKQVFKFVMLHARKCFSFKKRLGFAPTVIYTQATCGLLDFLEMHHFKWFI